MFKFCQNLKNYFSSSFLPYNPKGYTDISQYIKYHESIKRKLQTFDVSDNQFIFAYNNFLNSIQDNDFNQYAHEVCDKKLANQFIEGLSKIQKKQLTFEKVINDNVQEQIYYTDSNVFIYVDRNISLYDHLSPNTKGENPKLTALISEGKELLNCYSIGAFIKSKLSIKISGCENEPENFHHVRFLVLKDSKELKSLYQTLKSLLIFNEKEIYFGNNPTWKILDIDRCMEKQYPEYF
ncbi:unnamed protein product [Paramecium pentaurelia]|uniref:Uncharacterized protein n=1 Tax=Paramecium pentaurelia TaxID=43138 RepID=A0A8S1TFW5_9CILI|nr:unnamed protein product [Paramecium pentaurelia]